MANQAKKPASDKQKQSRPVIIDGETVSSSSASSTQAEDVTAAVSRVFASLKRATQATVAAPAQVVQDSSSQLVQSASELQKKAAKAAIKAYLAQQENAKPPAINAAIEAKAQELVQGTKSTLKHVRDAVDPRVVAGGLAGLTAGEIVGGVVGGVAGGAVAGPAGAVVGAQVVGFSAGMLGLKLGADAVYDNLEAKRTNKANKTPGESSRKTSVGRFLQIKTGERLGEIVGLTSGASLGLVIAGPAGGLVGAVLGEALGGHIGEDLNRPKSDKQTQRQSTGTISQWVDRFGKNTAGEAATVLVAGSVGSIFGPSGRLVGHRIGLIVGKRIEWHKLGDETDEVPAPAQPTIQPIALPERTPKAKNTADHARLPAEPALVFSDQTDDEAAPLLAEPPVHFTRRQLEVLSLLSQQLDDAEIAEKLNITTATVNYHKRNIYKKLKANSSTDAAFVAFEFEPGAFEQ
ncbi:MAG: helix-turn-helix transcriptional regulator [Anaerolineae bacterium]|nr:helix-turn-helix transcriptional regulator [Anaerolineae bacterium]